VQLTGEVGAGKTTLCRALLNNLTAIIHGPDFEPVMTGDELMKAIATSSAWR